MKRTLFSTGLSILAAVVLAHAQASPYIEESKVDEVFARWTQQTPGCAVGVSKGGASVLQKAYGMADLEHDVPNRPDTIFEAGSVSKQFTAAAVLLLAGDGKLALDDAVRKYVPELPDYGLPLTIRHMLTHTSGLRDWGEVAAIAGWPRTSRVHTHAHALDIISRQKALNFPPGTQYSYSNSGYNLAAMIVARVSGKSFAEFSRERIFEPLGMTRTSWRDDYTRIVKGRAIAYSQAGDRFRMNMPFEDVHGNGGLLTTVGDLLKWNENFVTPMVGDRDFVRLQQEPGKFNDGKPHQYAMGLFVRPYKGLPEVSHSGSTAGYRAHLTRFPEQHLSVAVLCNVAGGSATQYAMAVADMYLAGNITAITARQEPRPRRQESTYAADAKALASYVGRYYSDEAEVAYEVALDGGALVIKRRPDTVIRLRPTAKDEFAAASTTYKFLRAGDGVVNELSLRGSRVFDLRFQRQTPGSGSSH
ncbi:MAG TPA: serine hydrolase domain-containing protein [Vicinamibacterales bacterium]|nr:serine hydrolase domain-containing protein [Vicinamibacterales bacterium]